MAFLLYNFLVCVDKIRYIQEAKNNFGIRVLNSELWLKTWLILTLTYLSWNEPKSYPRRVHFFLRNLGIKKNLWYYSKKLHMQEIKVRSSGTVYTRVWDAWKLLKSIFLSRNFFGGRRLPRPERHRLHFYQVKRTNHSWEKTFLFSTTKLLFIPAEQQGKWSWKQARCFSGFSLGVNLFT